MRGCGGERKKGRGKFQKIKCLQNCLQGVIILKSIAFLEKMLKIATKPEDIEFLVSLLFDLKNDLEME